MSFFKTTYWQYCIVAALAVAVFCYWLWLFPYIPVVRETSQLFLWTGDYFTERIVTPGGTARYLGEMIAQCFINPVNGAIAYTVIFVIAQLLSCRLFRQLFPTMKTAYRFVLSLVVPVALWLLGMVPSIPLTLTVAVIMVLGAGCAVMALPAARRLWVLLPTIAVVYWLAGTDFYDYDEEVGKEMGTYEEMECDLLLRQGEWHEIIRRFPQPESPAVRSAVILAYHKTGQMGRQDCNATLSKRELMQNLVVPSEQHGSSLSVFNISDTHFVVNFGSLSSAFIACDLAYQLYWTNIAQRTAFEAMEFIPNYNKSGRALKRLVETNIISGHYDVARKYIAILEKTTFYSGWAQKMRQLVDHPEQIVNYPFLHSAQKEYENTTDIFFI